MSAPANGFVIIRQCAGLSPSERCFLDTLLSFDGPQGICPGDALLMHELECSVSKLDKLVKRLERAGLLITARIAWNGPNGPTWRRLFVLQFDIMEQHKRAPLQHAGAGDYPSKCTGSPATLPGKNGDTSRKKWGGLPVKNEDTNKSSKASKDQSITPSKDFPPPTVISPSHTHGRHSLRERVVCVDREKKRGGEKAHAGGLSDDQFEELTAAYGPQGGLLMVARHEADAAACEPGFDLATVLAHLRHPGTRKVLKANTDHALWLSAYLRERRWRTDPLPPEAVLADRWPPGWDKDTDSAVAHGVKLGIPRPRDEIGPVMDPAYKMHLWNVRRAELAEVRG